MDRDSTLRNFLREVAMRIGAAAVVFGVFVGVGYLSRTDAFGLNNLLGDSTAFFVVGFLVVAALSVSWILIQRHRYP
jgi:hypothetical protein